MRKLMLVLTCAVFISACGKDDDDQAQNTTQNQTAQDTANPGSGATADFRGTWSGNVQANGSSTNATLTLSQSGDQVSGTIATPAGTTAISGNVSGNTLNFVIGPNDALNLPCGGAATGTATLTGNRVDVVMNSGNANITSGGGLAARNGANITTVGGNVITISSGNACPSTLAAQGTFTQTSSNASIGLRLGA
jgi:hypothetical protein